MELAQCSTELLEDNLACRQIEMTAAGILEERHISSSPASQGSSRKVAENNGFFDLTACARLQDITHAIKRRLSICREAYGLAQAPAPDNERNEEGIVG